jgi:hypothetical protein
VIGAAIVVDPVVVTEAELFCAQAGAARALSTAKAVPDLINQFMFETPEHAKSLPDIKMRRRKPPPRLDSLLVNGTAVKCNITLLNILQVTRQARAWAVSLWNRRTGSPAGFGAAGQRRASPRR